MSVLFHVIFQAPSIGKHPLAHRARNLCVLYVLGLNVVDGVVLLDRGERAVKTEPFRLVFGQFAQDFRLNLIF